MRARQGTSRWAGSLSEPGDRGYEVRSRKWEPGTGRWEGPEFDVRIAGNIWSFELRQPDVRRTDSPELRACGSARRGRLEDWKTGRLDVSPSYAQPLPRFAGGSRRNAQLRYWLRLQLAGRGSGSSLRRSRCSSPVERSSGPYVRRVLSNWARISGVSSSCRATASTASAASSWERRRTPSAINRWYSGGLKDATVPAGR